MAPPDSPHHRKMEKEGQVISSLRGKTSARIERSAQPVYDLQPPGSGSRTLRSISTCLLTFPDWEVRQKWTYGRLEMME